MVVTPNIKDLGGFALFWRYAVICLMRIVRGPSLVIHHLVIHHLMFIALINVRGGLLFDIVEKRFT